MIHRRAPLGRNEPVDGIVCSGPTAAKPLNPAQSMQPTKGDCEAEKGRLRPPLGSARIPSRMRRLGEDAEHSWDKGTGPRAWGTRVICTRVQHLQGEMPEIHSQEMFSITFQLYIMDLFSSGQDTT